mmetsp:Transcript_65309/g.128431  ORF Transcript_65309/g.128431 Transcript_65309/m.128431 type:complete len:524 (-) Transcript_65309:91-1662(-)
MVMWVFLLLISYFWSSSALSHGMEKESYWVPTGKQQRALTERDLSFEHPHIHLGKLATVINSTIDPIVDASLAELARVYHPGNLCPFKRKISSKLSKGEKIKIIIAGGSVTYGADLQDRMKQRWSTYFTELLTSGWYSGGVEVVNIGVGACNVDTWIYKVHEMNSADLVIVDLTVNDQGFDLQALPHLYKTFIQLIDELPNHPALLFHQAFRTAKKDASDITKHCPGENEHGSCCNGFLFCKRWWDMQDFVGIALNKLGVPFMSYRDLAWPVFESPPDQLDVWWNGMSHPDYRAHKMIAKLLAFGFMMQVKDAHTSTHCTIDGDDSRYVSSTEIDQTVRPICSEALTLMHAGNSPESVEFIPGKVTGGSNMWRYFNDSQLKYGWILEASKEAIAQKCSQGETWCSSAIEASIISFDVELGPSPRLQVSFLKSQFENMGHIAMWVDDKREHTVLINGWWDMPYSVAHTMTFTRDPLVNYSTAVVGDVELLPSLSVGKHVVHFSLPPESNKHNGFKWKLLGLTAC